MGTRTRRRDFGGPIVIRLFLAFAVLLSVVGAVATVDTHEAAAYEANCSYGGFQPAWGSAASSVGIWVSCTTAAGSGRYRSSEVCAYQDGVLVGCRTYSSSAAYFENWYTHTNWTVMVQHRFQMWYWFRDQYGATASVWGGNFYVNKRMI